MKKVIVHICMVLFCLSCTTAYAQNPPASQTGGPAAPGKSVVFNNRTIFTVQDIQGYSAKERVRTITDRVTAIAENPAFDTGSIATVAYHQPMTLISIGTELIMVVFDDDSKAAGISREELAKRWSLTLKAAIDRYRQEHSVKWLITGGIKTVVATVVLIVVLLVLNRLYRKADKALKDWLGRKKMSIHLQSFELVKAERLGSLISGLLNSVRFIFIFIVVYSYFHNVLSSFPWTEAYASQILHFVVRPFQVIGEALWVQIPNLFFAAIIFLLAFYVVKLLEAMFREVEKGSVTFKGFHPEWARPTYKICRTLTAVVALIMAFPYIPGSGSPAFKGISIFLGILFSLGSTSFISNILAGYSLIYRRAFKVGDRVKIGDFMGDVMEMRLEVTHLKTIKNEEIVVPNSVINNSHVVNYSSLAGENGLILHTKVTIGYDTPWRQIHALLLMAAERTPGLLKEPKPFILQTSLDDFYVSYELNAYTDNPHAMVQIYSDLHRNIQDAFNEYGVQIMSPNYRFDPANPKTVPRDRWYEAPAAPPGSDGEQ